MNNKKTCLKALIRCVALSIGCEPDAHGDECQQETHGTGYFDVSTQEYKLYAQTQ
jgi:hypothetical protein